MKIALVLYGNLRTFFMKTRESNFRVCDIIMQNIIEPNNPDIFINTDTYDFFYNDAQYFCSNQINLVNNDGFRLYPNVKFIEPNEAKNIIDKELRNFLGNKIKYMIINDYQDNYLDGDPKYELLKDKIGWGPCPTLLVGQYKKLYKGWEIMNNYEKNNGEYDLIIKCRFDAGFNQGQRWFLSSFDYQNCDVYVPCIRRCMVDDWCAFGNRKGMTPYLKLYEELGFTHSNPTYIIECNRDGSINYFGPEPDKHMQDPCQHCGKHELRAPANITLSSEHHIYALFEKLGIRYKISGHFAYVYRYRDTSFSKPAGLVIKEDLKLKNITLFNHTPNDPITKEDF